MFRVGNGEWAFDGVEMFSRKDSNGTTVVTCKSTHLTSFAVLVNVADGDSDVCVIICCNHTEYAFISYLYSL